MTAQVGCDLDDFNVVTKVKAGSPAARAGMQVSDKITEVDGEPLDGRKVQETCWRRRRCTRSRSCAGLCKSCDE